MKRKFYSPDTCSLAAVNLPLSLWLHFRNINIFLMSCKDGTLLPTCSHALMITENTKWQQIYSKRRKWGEGVNKRQHRSLKVNPEREREKERRDWWNAELLSGEHGRGVRGVVGEAARRETAAVASKCSSARVPSDLHGGRCTTWGLPVFVRGMFTTVIHFHFFIDHGRWGDSFESHRSVLKSPYRF